MAKIANSYGSQCVVLSIDVKPNKDSEYEVWGERGQKKTNLKALDWAKETIERGAKLVSTHLQGTEHAS